MSARRRSWMTRQRLVTGAAAVPEDALLQAARIGRGERIRTSGPCLPKTVLYQAELLPDRNARPFRRAGGAGRL